MVIVQTLINENVARNPDYSLFKFTQFSSHSRSGRMFLNVIQLCYVASLQLLNQSFQKIMERRRAIFRSLSAVVTELEFSLPEYVRLLCCLERGRERFKKVISLIPGKRFF